MTGIAPPTVELDEFYNEDYLALAEFVTPEERTLNEAAFIAKALELQPGMKILDLGCGNGRIAHELARSGALVTGIDAAPLMLDYARARAARDGLSIDYRLADMSELRGLTGFDAALSWHFAFGYGDDRQNARMLAAICKALRRDGCLLFDQYNTLALAGDPEVTFLDQGDRLFIHKRVADLEAGRWGAERIVVRGGRIRRSRFTCRCYSPPELKAMLLGAGFRQVRFLGDGFTPFAQDSNRLIVAALK